MLKEDLTTVAGFLLTKIETSAPKVNLELTIRDADKANDSIE